MIIFFGRDHSKIYSTIMDQVFRLKLMIFLYIQSNISVITIFSCINIVFLLFSFKEEKRQVPSVLKKILDLDVYLTKAFVNTFEKYVLIRQLQTHYKALEVFIKGIFK